MAFADERDELRPEVKIGTAGVVTYWIKVDGANAVATSAAFALFDSSGVALQAEMAVAPSDVADVGSMLSMAIPAITTLQDGARIDLRFTVDSVEHYDTMLFDVVRTPWVRSGGVSLNDLREERPDVDTVLDRIGQRFGFVAGDEAQIGAAKIYAYRARVILDSWLRASATQQGKLRAALIIDRRALLRTERLLALFALFLGLAENPGEGEEESSALARYYEKAARDAYSAIRFEYDSTEDGVVDASPKPGIVHTRRVQGR